MIDLNNIKLSFILITPSRLDVILSFLYGKDYNIIEIKSYFNDKYEDSIIAFSDVSNDVLRSDLILLLNQFDQEFGIIKYKGETNFKKVFSDGSEKPMSVSIYNIDDENVRYIYNDISFSFIEENRYWKPTKMEDFRVGMIVEYLNNNKWCQKKVENPLIEWDDMFKLLTKYDRVRICSN